MIKYRKKIKRGLLFLVMVFLSFVVNIPNISMIGTALKPFGGYMSDKSLFPSNPDFSMLRKVLFGTTFGRYLANSVFIALVVVVFCVVFASCAGYALSRCRGKVFTGYTVFLLMLQMFPLVLVLIPLFWIFKTLGLVACGKAAGLPSFSDVPSEQQQICRCKITGRQITITGCGVTRRISPGRLPPFQAPAADPSCS